MINNIAKSYFLRTITFGRKCSHKPNKYEPNKKIHVRHKRS